MKAIQNSLLRPLLIAIAALLLSFSTNATMLPDTELVWKNVAMDNHFSTVFSFYRDGRGMMWLGTKNGLYFYDGVSARPVGKSQLSSHQIYSMVERNNVLYLGTNNGVWTYDYTHGEVKALDASLPKEIRCMLLVDNVIYIGGLYGLHSFNTETQEIEELTHGGQPNAVYSIMRDSRGVIYLGTYNGLSRLDNATGHITSVFGNRFVNCLMEAPQEQCIYVGCEGVLYRYYPTTDRREALNELKGVNIKSITQNNNGTIIVGTDNGVALIKGKAVDFYRHDSRRNWSLSNNEIWCVYCDDENVWTGHERGFSIASNSSFKRIIKLSSIANSGEGNDIYTIFRDSHKALWLGGTNGVICLDAQGNKHWFRHSNAPKSLSHNRVRNIFESKEKEIWLSTDGGVNRYNPTRQNFDVYHITDTSGQYKCNWVYAIDEDDTHLWVGSYLGAIQRVAKGDFGNNDVVTSNYTLNSSTIINGVSIANNFVNNIVMDHTGNLWILLYRDSKVNCLAADGRLWTCDLLQLTGNYPTAIELDNRGRLWCGMTGGAAVFDGMNAPKIVQFPYTANDGIIAMGKVGNDMLISTVNNVWHIDGNTLGAKLLSTPQKYYTAIYEDRTTNKVILGSCDEIIEMDINQLNSGEDIKTINMVLNITDNDKIALDNLKVEDDGVEIPSGGGVTLVVSTLDYSPESVHRYMYQLSEDNKSGEWVVMPEGANTIALSGLKMGDYKIKVKTVGSPLKAYEIPLTVHAPWTLSWWAITIYIIAIIALVAMVVLAMRRRNHRLLQEKERLAALENVDKKLTFLSNISHDFKTPLSMIMGPVSVLKERTTDAALRQELERIYGNAVKLNNLIHRTVEVNQFNDDSDSLLILSTFNIVDFCQSVVNSFKENNSQKKFIFHSNYPQILIEADAVKIESVITNLISNACKYSNDGATITCGIDVHNDKVEISISDDGLGIKEEDQTLVFQRMFRSPSTAHLREGTGLGLYLIKKYLELMKGNIDLYSKEGQGTLFVVSLPITHNSIPDVKKEHTTDSGKPKILIVEDNEEISTFIAQILSHDYTTLVAGNGRSGLAVAASITPDLIVVDEMMPIMTGMEMCRQLKQNPRLMAVPIIMLTAKDDNATENESIKTGIDAFMSKPFEPSLLTARIAHLLGSRNAIKERVRIESITEVKPIEAESHTEKLLAKIAQIIEENISDPDLNVNTLCEKCDIPNKQLYRITKKYVGLSPLDYIRRVRLQKAAMLLTQHQFTVSEICYMVGFKTPSYFAKCFQGEYGVKPSMYQGDVAPKTTETGE